MRRALARSRAGTRRSWISSSISFSAKSETLSPLDEADESNCLDRVLSVPPEGTTRGSEEAAPLVVAQRLDIHAGLGSDLTDREGLAVHDALRMHPILMYRCNRPMRQDESQPRPACIGPFCRGHRPQVTGSISRAEALVRS